MGCVKSTSGILGLVSEESAWNEFLDYKVKHQQISNQEEQDIRQFIEDKMYLKASKAIKEGTFLGLPSKRFINKEGTSKKRVVYTFEKDVNIVLKFIAARLYELDDYFASNCYAFRRGFGVADAIRKLSGKRADGSGIYSGKYCLKVDISNYFNSIDVDKLIDKLDFVKSQDGGLYDFFVKLLSEKCVLDNGKVVEECHGAMAGVPVASFFANVYLTDVDKMYGDDYYRYSDDILIFADSMAELKYKQDRLYNELKDLGLTVNSEKEHIYEPEEHWEFLGFAYYDGRFDLSYNTKRKIKAKIKRKAEALRRWQRKKNLTSDKAAIGFIKAMNKKFYGKDEEDDFTWNRWFFPNLSMDLGLKEIDQYMQQYIRYCITGRHYKGNYNITYDMLKEWGYRSLVNEFYNYKSDGTVNIRVNIRN